MNGKILKENFAEMVTSSPEPFMNMPIEEVFDV